MGAGTESEQEAPFGYLLQRGGHRREHARVAVGDVEHHRTQHDGRHDGGERAQRRPALEHVGGVVHPSVEVVVGPDPPEPGVDGDVGGIAQLGPPGAERIEQQVDVHGVAVDDASATGDRMAGLDVAELGFRELPA